MEGEGKRINTSLLMTFHPIIFPSFSSIIHATIFSCFSRLINGNIFVTCCIQPQLYISLNIYLTCSTDLVILISSSISFIHCCPIIERTSRNNTLNGSICSSIGKESHCTKHPTEMIDNILHSNNMTYIYIYLQYMYYIINTI